MPDVPAEFEITDRLGTTEQFNGNVGTTSTAVPAVAMNAISEVYVRNVLSIPSARKLLVSFDSGGTFYTLNRSESIIWGIKGEIDQIFIKSDSSTVDYEIVMNLEIS